MMAFGGYIVIYYVLAWQYKTEKKHKAVHVELEANNVKHFKQLVSINSC